ncbi:DUF2512 family protein [Exiguobacterium sp. s138]|uniref:DUF2512 family protein n=1 Tax=Exiguobacterium sp. s138 TaxID=2751202 RepID=UPI001BE77E29|nr:DUF2512 family protein [Exiguobacterium sp. s138]
MNWSHGKALMVKLPALLIIFLLILTVGFDIEWYHSVWMALAIGIIAYLLDDYVILRKAGNLIATSADFGLVFLLTWFFTGTVQGEYTKSIALAGLYTGLVTAVVEYFFHEWLLKNRQMKEVHKRSHLSKY